MALSGIVISSIVYELRTRLTGGRIAKIAQTEADELLLTVNAPVSSYKLLISANASVPKMHLTKTVKPSPISAPAFCMLLRKHLGGGHITDIRQVGLERVICIDIEHTDEMGDMSVKTLLVELMGRYSNIILLDGNKIIDSIKRIPAGTSSLREVLPGREYYFPAELTKNNPFELDRESFCRLRSDMPAADWLCKNISGISTAFACEICERAGVDSDALPDDTALCALYEVLHSVIEQISKGDFCNVIYYRDNIPVEFCAFRLRTLSSLSCREFESAGAMLEAFYFEKDLASRARQKSAELRHRVGTLLERAVKKLELQERQLADSDKRGKYRLYGELIRANAYSIKPGAKSAELADYYNGGAPLTVPLDENLSVQDNATKYFEKYRKLKRTYDALTVLISQTEKDIEYLRSIDTSITFAETESDLAIIYEELAQSGFIKKTVSGRKVKSQKSNPLHFISCDGFDIYVGKNNLQNEQLTFKLAEGNDLWFHAKAAAGSHVILKCGNAEPSDAGYEEAAALALRFSSIETDKGEVDYTRRKNIKKPSGALPGKVIYHVYSSMIVKNDISGIKKVR